MTSSFWAKQLNDIRPENMADALNRMSAEGFTQWEFVVQEDQTEIRPAEILGRGELRIGRPILYRLLVWGKDEEDDESIS